MSDENMNIKWECYILLVELNESLKYKSWFAAFGNKTICMYCRGTRDQYSRREALKYRVIVPKYFFKFLPPFGMLIFLTRKYYAFMFINKVVSIFLWAASKGRCYKSALFSGNRIKVPFSQKLYNALYDSWGKHYTIVIFLTRLLPNS